MKDESIRDASYNNVQFTVSGNGPKVYSIQGTLVGTYIADEFNAESEGRYDFDFNYRSEEFKKTPSVLSVAGDEATNEEDENEYLYDLVEASSDKPEVMQDIILGVFNVNIYNDFIKHAREGKSDLVGADKVVDIYFDSSKMSVDKLVVVYENKDGDQYYETVFLPETVTNAKVNKVVPGYSLPLVRHKFKSWLEDDYESTIDLANDIFGFDLETLKGAKKADE